VGLSLPNDDFWVNLRPDSPDEMINADLARTDVGRILLEADVQLKKDTAAATSPKTPAGKAYWDKLYQKAESLYGSENITIPTLTRPWIVPDEIIVREAQGSAYIYKATLKVMLEQDYLKNSSAYNFTDERAKELNEYSSQIIRETITPKLTKEINSSKRYAGLRQVYYSLILAQWFKQKYGNGIGKGAGGGRDNQYISRIDSKDLTDLTSKTSWDKDTYFKAYQKSFKDGEYNIKDNRNTVYGQTIRSYFSGGISFGSDSAGGGIARCIEAGLIAASRMREFSGNRHVIAADFSADGGITIEKTFISQEIELKNETPFLPIVGKFDSSGVGSFFLNKAGIEKFDIPNEFFSRTANWLRAVIPSRKVNLVKAIEETLKGYEPAVGSSIIGIFGSLGYAGWEMAGDADIKICLEKEVSPELKHEITAAVFKKLRGEYHLEIKAQAMDAEYSDSAGLLQQQWGIKNLRTQKSFRLAIYYNTFDELFPLDENRKGTFKSYRLSDLYFGDLAALNQLDRLAQAAGKDALVTQTAYYYNGTLDQIKSDFATWKDKQTRVYVGDRDANKLLKRLFMLAYIRGEENRFSWLLEKYEKFEKNFNPEEYEEICKQAITDLDIDEPALKAIIESDLLRRRGRSQGASAEQGNGQAQNDGGIAAENPTAAQEAGLAAGGLSALTQTLRESGFDARGIEEVLSGLSKSANAQEDAALISRLIKTLAEKGLNAYTQEIIYHLLGHETTYASAKIKSRIEVLIEDNGALESLARLDKLLDGADADGMVWRMAVYHKDNPKFITEEAVVLADELKKTGLNTRDIAEILGRITYAYPDKISIGKSFAKLARTLQKAKSDTGTIGSILYSLVDYYAHKQNPQESADAFSEIAEGLIQKGYSEEINYILYALLMDTDPSQDAARLISASALEPLAMISRTLRGEINKYRKWDKEQQQWEEPYEIKKNLRDLLINIKTKEDAEKLSVYNVTELLIRLNGVLNDSKIFYTEGQKNILAYFFKNANTIAETYQKSEDKDFFAAGFIIGHLKDLVNEAERKEFAGKMISGMMSLDDLNLYGAQIQTLAEALAVPAPALKKTIKLIKLLQGNLKNIFYSNNDLRNYMVLADRFEPGEIISFAKDLGEFGYNFRVSDATVLPEAVKNKEGVISDIKTIQKIIHGFKYDIKTKYDIEDGKDKFIYEPFDLLADNLAIDDLFIAILSAEKEKQGATEEFLNGLTGSYDRRYSAKTENERVNFLYLYFPIGKDAKKQMGREFLANRDLLAQKGFIPFQNLIQLLTESKDKEILLSEWESYDPQQAKDFNPDDPVKISCDWRRFNKKYVTYQAKSSEVFSLAWFENALNSFNKLAENGVSESKKAELSYTSYEIKKFYEFVKSLNEKAKQSGRKVLVVPNFTYGWFLVTPIREAMERSGVNIVDVRVGSTEAHNDEFLIAAQGKDGMFDKKTLEFIIRENPVIVMVDGSNSFAGERDVDPRYPDAHKAFVNTTMLLNYAFAGEKFIPAADTFREGNEHMDELLKGENPKKLLEEIKGVIGENNIETRQDNIYGVKYYNPNNFKAVLTMDGRGEARKARGTPIPYKKEDINNLDLESRSYLFVTSVNTRAADMPGYMKGLNKGRPHSSASIDDNINKMFIVNQQGLNPSHTFADEFKKQYSIVERLVDKNEPDNGNVAESPAQKDGGTVEREATLEKAINALVATLPAPSTEISEQRIKNFEVFYKNLPELAQTISKKYRDLAGFGVGEIKVYIVGGRARRANKFMKKAELTDPLTESSDIDIVITADKPVKWFGFVSEEEYWKATGKILFETLKEFETKGAGLPVRLGQLYSRRLAGDDGYEFAKKLNKYYDDSAKGLRQPPISDYVWLDVQGFGVKLEPEELRRITEEDLGILLAEDAGVAQKDGGRQIFDLNPGDAVTSKSGTRREVLEVLGGGRLYKVRRISAAGDIREEMLLRDQLKDPRWISGIIRGEVSLLLSRVEKLKTSEPKTYYRALKLLASFIDLKTKDGRAYLDLRGDLDQYPGAEEAVLNALYSKLKPGMLTRGSILRDATRNMKIHGLTAMAYVPAVMAILETFPDEQTNNNSAGGMADDLDGADMKARLARLAPALGHMGFAMLMSRIRKENVPAPRISDLVKIAESFDAAGEKIGPNQLYYLLTKTLQVQDPEGEAMKAFTDIKTARGLLDLHYAVEELKNTPARSIAHTFSEGVEAYYLEHAGEEKGIPEEDRINNALSKFMVSLAKAFRRDSLEADFREGFIFNLTAEQTEKTLRVLNMLNPGDDNISALLNILVRHNSDVVDKLKSAFSYNVGPATKKCFALGLLNSTDYWQEELLRDIKNEPELFKACEPVFIQQKEKFFYNLGEILRVFNSGIEADRETIEKFALGNMREQAGLIKAILSGEMNGSLRKISEGPKMFMRSLWERQAQAGSARLTALSADIIAEIFCHSFVKEDLPEELRSALEELSADRAGSLEPRVKAVANYITLRAALAREKRFIEAKAYLNNYETFLRLESELSAIAVRKDISREMDRQLRGLAWEAWVMKERVIKKLQEKTRALLVIGNLSYGWPALAPLVEKNKEYDPYIKGTGIPVLYTRVGSTEARYNDYILLDGTQFTDEQIKLFLEKSPNVVIADASVSVANPEKGFPHLPASFKGYRNFFIVLDYARHCLTTGDWSNPGKFTVDWDPGVFLANQSFVERLLQTKPARDMVNRIRAMRINPAQASSYKFRFFYDREESGQKEGDLSFRFDKFIPVPKVDMADIGDSPVCVFVQTAMHPEDVPAGIKDKFIGGEYTPAYFDDTKHFDQLWFERKHGQVVLSNRIEEVSQRLSNELAGLAATGGNVAGSENMDGGKNDLEDIWAKLPPADKQSWKRLIKDIDSGDIRNMHNGLVFNVEVPDAEGAVQSKKVKLDFYFEGNEADNIAADTIKITEYAQDNTTETAKRSYPMKYKHGRANIRLDNVYIPAKIRTYDDAQSDLSLESVLADRLGLKDSTPFKNFDVEVGFYIVYNSREDKYKLLVDENIENSFDMYCDVSGRVREFNAGIKQTARPKLGDFEKICAEGHFHPAGDEMISLADMYSIMKRVPAYGEKIPEIIATVKRTLQEEEGKPGITIVKTNGLPKEEPMKEQIALFYYYLEDMKGAQTAFKALYQESGFNVSSEQMQGITPRYFSRQAIVSDLSGGGKSVQADGGIADSSERIRYLASNYKKIAGLESMFTAKELPFVMAGKQDIEYLGGLSGKIEQKGEFRIVDLKKKIELLPQSMKVAKSLTRTRVEVRLAEIEEGYADAQTYSGVVELVLRELLWNAYKHSDQQIPIGVDINVIKDGAEVEIKVINKSPQKEVLTQFNSSKRGLLAIGEIIKGILGGEISYDFGEINTVTVRFKRDIGDEGGSISAWTNVEALLRHDVKNVLIPIQSFLGFKSEYGQSAQSNEIEDFMNQVREFTKNQEPLLNDKYGDRPQKDGGESRAKTGVLLKPFEVYAILDRMSEGFRSIDEGAYNKPQMDPRKYGQTDFTPEEKLLMEEWAREQDRLFGRDNDGLAQNDGGAEIEENKINAVIDFVFTNTNPKEVKAATAFLKEHIETIVGLAVQGDNPEPAIKFLKYYARSDSDDFSKRMSRLGSNPGDIKAFIENAGNEAAVEIEDLDLPEGLEIISNDNTPIEVRNSKYQVKGSIPEIKIKDFMDDVSDIENQNGADGGVNEAKGGIDFRGLPLTIQPSGVVNPAMARLPSINIADLDKEWKQIEKMSAGGMVPSTDRIAEFLGACKNKDRVAEYSDNIVACIAQIMRNEEGEAKTTDPRLKNMLVKLESGVFTE